MRQTKAKEANLKLYAITNMQTKNQTRNKKKKKLAPPPYLDQTYYSKKNKVKEGDREQRGTSSPG